MIKYALISIILYYVVVRYLRPGVQQDNHNAQNNNQPKNNHEDEYVDYEEVN
ncbi:MAG TPA: hypothetical protein PK611_02040 [Saprospiraceae bacterium]|nr:hypothetical protein [Saprospiraceae bacterium]HRO09715.1 hypothetical protein [Saprospiraceae bacterium]HRO72431.1 hypothetical protein [Saprospiraceae bacterium]HRP42971.1 hypothetical protein [Saprospiraceae bacterium]